MIRLPWRLWIWLAVAAALAVAAWYAYRAIYDKGAASRDAEVAELKLANRNILLGYATAAQQAEQVIREKQNEKAAAIAALDAKGIKELKNAKTHYERDLAAVRAGTLGVRINGADCAAAGSRGLPAATGAAGMADGTAGGLPAGVSERVLGLRNSIESDATKVRGLQDYIRAACWAGG